MSSDIAVRLEGLGKEYELGEKVRGYATLRETISGAVGGMFRRDVRARRNERDVVVALDDLTFDIAQGETVGFIGHNGAGKSTLLKILARITEPTRGWGEISGRVGALLEVGTGFHPELTGRENIYLNGAVLGMRQREIERRFDDIAAFSGVERFLDTPVKRYSSGMTVRLAFSVAAHLDPEVLIVDEVLAVGDAAFQRQCLDRIVELAGDGRTVLFVSHNMAVIQGLCQRGIVLERGRVIADAPIDDAVAAYLSTIERAQVVPLADRTDRKGEGGSRAVSIEVSGERGAPSTGAPATIEVRVAPPIPDLTCELTLFDHVGIPLATMWSANFGADDDFDGAPDTFVCDIAELALKPGRYRVDVSLIQGNKWHDQVFGAAFFDVEQGRLGGRAVLAEGRGQVALRHRWTSPRR